jgi:acetyltransferase
MMTEAEATAKLLVEYNKRKPIIPVFIGGESIMKGVEVLHTAGMVNFTFPKDAVEALDNLARGSAKIGATGLGETKVSNSGAGTPSKSGTTVECSRPNTNSFGMSKMMSYEEMSKLFREYDLNLPGILVHEKNDLADAMKKAGAKPYTLKAMSPDVIHKTDMGAVKLHLNNVTDLETAWDEIVSSVKSKKPQAIIEGMLFQIMSPGKEIIVGMKRDATFGPTILFGLGGIFTEALKDTSLRIAPISKETALEMIHQIRGINILAGLRGEQPIDFSKLADIIVKISKLSVDHPEIKEIDLNPVMVRTEGADIVDARVMI